VDPKSSIFWNITPGSPVKANDKSEEYIPSIFTVEVWAKQETSRSRRQAQFNILRFAFRNQ
jgi:hypothetical protein